MGFSTRSYFEFIIWEVRGVDGVAVGRGIWGYVWVEGCEIDLPMV